MSCLVRTRMDKRSKSGILQNKLVSLGVPFIHRVTRSPLFRLSLLTPGSPVCVPFGGRGVNDRSTGPRRVN